MRVKKIGIIGAGNIGSKIGLFMTELGAKVFLNRRNKKKLKCIVNAINYLKPRNTKEKAQATNKMFAAKNADVLIGSTDGKSVIDEKMVASLKKKSIIIDAGKGTLTENAIRRSIERKIEVFRVDIFSIIRGINLKNIFNGKTNKQIIKN